MADDEDNHEIVNWLQDYLEGDADFGHRHRTFSAAPPPHHASQHMSPEATVGIQGHGLGGMQLLPISAAEIAGPSISAPGAFTGPAQSQGWLEQEQGGHALPPFSMGPGQSGWSWPEASGGGPPPAVAQPALQQSRRGPRHRPPAMVSHTGGWHKGRGGGPGYQYGEIAQLLEWEMAQPYGDGAQSEGDTRHSGFHGGRGSMRHPDGVQPDGGVRPDGFAMRDGFPEGTEALHFGPPTTSAPCPRSRPLANSQGGVPIPQRAQQRSPSPHGASLPGQPLYERPQPSRSAKRIPHQPPFARRTPSAPDMAAWQGGLSLPREPSGAFPPPDPSDSNAPLIRELQHLPRLQPGPSGAPPAVPKAEASGQQTPQLTVRSPACILEQALRRPRDEPPEAASKRARVDPGPEEGRVAGEKQEALPEGVGGADRKEQRQGGGAGTPPPVTTGLPPLPPACPKEDQGPAQAKQPQGVSGPHGDASAPKPRLEKPAKEARQWQAKREQFSHLMSNNLLRMAVCPDAHGGLSHTSMDATTASLRTEQANLRLARQATLLRIQELQQLLQVQEEAELSVRRLLTSLDQQRSRFTLEGNLNDVLRTVQNLNAACRTGPQGPNHYFSSGYAAACRALPGPPQGNDGGREMLATWLAMRDVSGEHSVIERAFAYANGDCRAGEVVVSLSSKVEPTTLALKDIPRMSAATYHRLMTGIFSTISDLVEQLEGELEDEVRQELIDTLNLVCTEQITFDHVYFVSNPLYYKQREHWSVKPAAESGKSRDAALARAVESLRSTKADMQGLRAIWKERNEKLGPLMRETQRVRREIRDMFAGLAAQPSETSVDYSDLMAAVSQLKRCVDDASLLLSVAVTASNVCVLTSFQMSMAIKAAFPHIVCWEQLLPAMELPLNEQPLGFLDSKPTAQPV